MRNKFFAVILVLMIAFSFETKSFGKDSDLKIDYYVVGPTPYEVRTISYDYYDYDENFYPIEGTEKVEYEDDVFLKVDEGGNFTINLTTSGAAVPLEWIMTFTEITLENYDEIIQDYQNLYGIEKRYDSEGNEIPYEQYLLPTEFTGESGLDEYGQWGYINSSQINLTSKTGTTNTITGTLAPGVMSCHIWLKIFDANSTSDITDDNMKIILGNRLGNLDLYVNNSKYFNQEFTYPLQNSSSENNNPVSSGDLPIAIVVPVLESDLEPGVLEKIAASENISVDAINFLTSLDISTPVEPTSEMKKEAAGKSLEFAAKLNTVTFKNSGYYLFKLNVPDELIGMSVNELKLYYEEKSALDSSAKGQAQAAFDPFTAFEVYNLLGDKANTLAGQVLVCLLPNAGQSLCMWFLKNILMLLAGTCNAWNFNTIGLLIFGGIMILVKKR